jgi:HK97 family phage major capsid protein
MAELETVLHELQTEQKTFVAKANEELKNLGTVTSETKTAIELLSKRIDDMDAEAQRKAAEGKREEKPWTNELKESDAMQRFIRGESGRAKVEVKDLNVFDRKTFTAASSAGFATSGVYQIDRTPGIVLEARRRVHPQDVLPSRPTSLAFVDFVKVNAAIADASPQGGEGEEKFENATTVTTVSRKVETIATYIKVSKQALSDWSELEGYLTGSLFYAVQKKLGQQIYAGAGTTNYVSGLVTNSTAFNTALLSAPAGWTKIDAIAAAAQQVDIAEEEPANFVMLNPSDAWDIRRTKDGEERYIIGNPTSNAPFSLWGLNVVESTVVTAGTFLVGSTSPAAAEIRNRQGITVELFMQNEDDAIKNLVTIRAEARLALVVYRPGAFIYGSLNSSPA